MNTCTDIESNLPLFLNGRLGVETEASVAEHLVSCSSCQAVLEDTFALFEGACVESAGATYSGSASKTAELPSNIAAFRPLPAIQPDSSGPASGLDLTRVLALAAALLVTLAVSVFVVSSPTAHKAATPEMAQAAKAPVAISGARLTVGGSQETIATINFESLRRLDFENGRL